MPANNQFESASEEKRPLSKSKKKNLAKLLKKKQERITAKIENKREKRKKKKQRLESVKIEKRERGELVEGLGTLVMAEKEVKMSGAMFEGYREQGAVDDEDEDDEDD
ncbi:uncharacterized protein EAF02_004151 [Botrytis sinoallii]|uniref:uncharacterized protein n=1 Tax=Botrytis sinoallii TaxID=1463999 RepID=UPI001902478E|nr:uncharacterized protein EAF02_004151 [Botrytis sinoallii]KAF7885642.1 hypothetical protein EAF02_004151 [Botrytis sinoallii]